MPLLLIINWQYNENRPYRNLQSDGGRPSSGDSGPQQTPDPSSRHQALEELVRGHPNQEQQQGGTMANLSVGQLPVSTPAWPSYKLLIADPASFLTLESCQPIMGTIGGIHDSAQAVLS